MQPPVPSELEKPKAWAQCTVILTFHCLPECVDHTPGFVQEESVLIGASYDHLTKQLDEAISQMIVNEIRDVFVPPHQINVRLVAFKQKPLYDHTMEERFQLAEHLKARGVDQFSKSNYENAFKAFSQALKFLLAFEVIKDESQTNWSSLKASLYNNLAACQLKLGGFALALSNCERCLGLEPLNVKALFRRANALVGMGELEQAEQAFQAVLEVEPTNRAALDGLGSVRIQRREGLKELGDRMKKMFD